MSVEAFWLLWLLTVFLGSIAWYTDRILSNQDSFHRGWAYCEAAVAAEVERNRVEPPKPFHGHTSQAPVFLTLDIYNHELDRMTDLDVINRLELAGFDTKAGWETLVCKTGFTYSQMRRQ